MNTTTHQGDPADETALCLRKRGPRTTVEADVTCPDCQRQIEAGRAAVLRAGRQVAECRRRALQIG